MSSRREWFVNNISRAVESRSSEVIHSQERYLVHSFSELRCLEDLSGLLTAKLELI